MNAERVFIDTNILLYAHDLDAGARHKAAAESLMKAWDGRVMPVVSVQVLQEFLVNLARRLDDKQQAADTVHPYLAWIPPRYRAVSARSAALR
jgi:predicted nucleic acid-binding protein